VTSAVVVLELRPSVIDEGMLDWALRLAGHALTRPRKMLGNAVKPLCAGPQLMAAGLDPAVRPGLIPLEGWLALAAVVSDDATSK
jgi:16S rRNA A1518/A1519 N6-dimethyltransferase RsmA/KsgA/DIM1 with predicted DNA glycosylase/AP lyase activity